MKLEKDIVTEVRKELDKIGCWNFKTNELSVSGIPDILGCYKGKFIALEAKRSSKHKATELQIYILNKIKNAGGFAEVIFPENKDDILKRLKEL